MTIEPMLIFQLTMMIILIIFCLYMIRFNLSLRLVKRISIYSIEPLVNDSISIFDNIYFLYQKIVNKLSSILTKSKLLVRYSYQYNKYIDYTSDKKAIDYIANKIIFVIALLIIKFISDFIILHVPTFLESFIIAVIGFYIPDIYNTYLSYIRHKHIKQDLLNAIIMLNNAFKSGRSTMQAIEIVKNELEGPIKEEFVKMHTEISYGLSLETVFKRFASRVKVEEISYITSSLAVLNKTGGNIIKVFSSIEKSLYSKYRLESELQALTSSSKAMIKILLILPFAFISIIMFLNPTYFNSLFDSFIGLTVLFVMIMFYLLYAFVIRKIMRVRL